MSEAWENLMHAAERWVKEYDGDGTAKEPEAALKAAALAFAGDRTDYVHAAQRASAFLAGFDAGHTAGVAQCGIDEGYPDVPDPQTPEQALADWVCGMRSDSPEALSLSEAERLVRDWYGRLDALNAVASKDVDQEVTAIARELMAHATRAIVDELTAEAERNGEYPPKEDHRG